MTFPRITRLVQLTLNVRDLDRTVGFYVDALGFSVESRATDRARLALGSQHIELLQAGKRRTLPGTARGQRPVVSAFRDCGRGHERGLRAPVPLFARADHAWRPAAAAAEHGFGDGVSNSATPTATRSNSHTHRDSGRSDGAHHRIPHALFLGIDHTALAVSDLEASMSRSTPVSAFASGRACSIRDRSRRGSTVLTGRWSTSSSCSRQKPGSARRVAALPSSGTVSRPRHRPRRHRRHLHDAGAVQAARCRATAPMPAGTRTGIGCASSLPE